MRAEDSSNFKDGLSQAVCYRDTKPETKVSFSLFFSLFSVFLVSYGTKNYRKQKFSFCFTTFSKTQNRKSIEFLFHRNSFTETPSTIWDLVFGSPSAQNSSLTTPESGLLTFLAAFLLIC